MQINQDRLLQIFFDLISISATSKQEKPVADYIRAFLQKLKIPVIEDQAGHIVGGNAGNIIAKIRPAGNNDSIPFCFTAHMDTVKPTAGIRPQVQNGKIITDGKTILGADNRAGIALILYLIESLQSIYSFQPFEVVFTIGEETGLYGSTHLDLTLLDSRVAYILDSSADPGSYVFAAPSAVDFTINFLGKASHAAVNPQDGINAISMAAHLIQNFSVGKISNETTVNFGKIQGGEANNIIPAHVTLSGEIRSFHKEHIDQLFQKLLNELHQMEKKFSGKYTLEREEAFPGFILDQKTAAIRRLESCFHAIGLEPHPLRYHGGSDANILNNRGMIAIDLGIGAKNPHSYEEYIRIDHLLMIEQLLYQLVNAKNEFTNK